MTTHTEIATTGANGSALTTAETETLARYEVTIEAGLKSFISVGRALLAIRDQRLYREKYRTFEAYLAKRWHIGRSTGYQMIAAAEVVEDVRNCGQTETLPANEAQARELATVPREDRAGVWQEVVETAPTNGAGEPVITAKHVETVVQGLDASDDEEPDDAELAADDADEPDDAEAAEVLKAAEFADELLKIHSQLKTTLGNTARMDCPNAAMEGALRKIGDAACVIIGELDVMSASPGTIPVGTTTPADLVELLRPLVHQTPSKRDDAGKVAREIQRRLIRSGAVPCMGKNRKRQNWQPVTDADDDAKSYGAKILTQANRAERDKAPRDLSDIRETLDQVQAAP